MKKSFNYLNKLKILIIFLNGLIWGQKEYNVENLILNGDSFTKKFSEEIVNGSIFIMMGDIKVVMGRMRNGKKYDRWVYWWDNGLKKSEGSYDLGEKHGKWTYYNSLGINDSIVYYKSSIKDGLYSTYYEDGKKKEYGNYNNGLRNGTWTKWWNNGNKEIEIVYSDGDLINKTLYDFDGNKINKSLSSKDEIKADAIINTKYGSIHIILYDSLAPKHVESFRLHAENGFYDGTIFHRVIPGFMIQGGDPNTKGENKTSYGIGGHSAKYYGIGKEDQPETWGLPSEFNNTIHKRGILSMARSSDPNSGGSQFFICLADAPHLNGSYTAFGKVTSGMEVADQIVNLPRDSRDNPKERVEMTINLTPLLNRGIPIPGFELDNLLNTFIDSTSYSLGADLGTNLKKQAVKIDYDVFMAGLTDAMTDGDLVKLNQEQRREVMASLQKSIRGQAKKEGEINLKKADEFLEKNKIDNSDIKETPTGLQYQVLNEGSGIKPIASDEVRVHYYGELMDGTVFDSSYERGEPIDFSLGQVIKGLSLIHI